MVALEVTKRCNLSCLHCRASSGPSPDVTELSLPEWKRILQDIRSFSSPTIILTGGEPLLRDDLFDLIAFGTGLGLRMVLATNGTLLDESMARRLRQEGIRRVSLSLDGKDAASHDSLRGWKGSFESVMKASEVMRREGLSFQINTTVTTMNAFELEDIYRLLFSIGASAWHLFFVVPVGRASALKAKELDAQDYEAVLRWLRKREEEGRIELKVTCAPHYNRVVKESGGEVKGGGCLAGRHFLFISHEGIAQPCGYLEVRSGNVREDGVRRVWEESEAFLKLRDLSSYKGKCGRCRYLSLCGGCRARAYEAYGDFLQEEPYCLFNP